MSQELPIRQSVISAYLHCPRKARFEYLEGKRSPTYPRMAIGTAGHKGADAYNHSAIAGKPITIAETTQTARDEAARLMAEVDFTQAKDADDERGKLADRAAAFAAGYVDLIVPTLGVITASERPFKLAFTVERQSAPNVTYDVTGTIDLETTAAVRDFKTTTRAGNIQPKHLVQLGTYALASTHEEEYLAKPDGVVDTIVMSETKKDGRRVRYLPTFIPAEALDAEAAIARQTIARVIEAAERGDYPRNPTQCDAYNRPCSHLPYCLPHRASVAETKAGEEAAAPVAKAPSAKVANVSVEYAKPARVGLAALRKAIVKIETRPQLQAARTALFADANLLDVSEQEQFQAIYDAALGSLPERLRDPGEEG